MYTLIFINQMHLKDQICCLSHLHLSTIEQSSHFSLLIPSRDFPLIPLPKYPNQTQKLAKHFFLVRKRVNWRNHLTLKCLEKLFILFELLLFPVIILHSVFVKKVLAISLHRQVRNRLKIKLKFRQIRNRALGLILRKVKSKFLINGIPVKCLIPCWFDQVLGVNHFDQSLFHF